MNVVNPEISIVVPVYNCEKYLKKCLDSLKNQTFPDIEIICVNDGSTDHSLEILQSYDDCRISIFNQENSGLSVARNVGASKAKGKYIYFCDSDDYIDNSLLEDLYNYSEKNNLDVCEGRTVFQYSDHSEPYTKYNKTDIFIGVESILSFYIGSYKKVNAWNKLIRRDCLSSIEEMFIPRQISEDYLWMFNQLLPRVSRAGFFYSEAAYHYVKNLSGTITSKHSIEHLDSYISIFDSLCMNTRLVEICRNTKSSMLGDLLFLCLKESYILMEYSEFSEIWELKIFDKRRWFRYCSMKRRIIMFFTSCVRGGIGYKILSTIFRKKSR